MNRRRATLPSAVVGAVVSTALGCAAYLGTGVATADTETRIDRDGRRGGDAVAEVRDDAPSGGGRRGNPKEKPRHPGHHHEWPWWPCFDPLILPPMPVVDRDGSGGVVIAAAPAVLAATPAQITALNPAVSPGAERALTGFGEAPAAPSAPPAGVAAGPTPPAPGAVSAPRSVVGPATAPKAPPPANRKPPPRQPAAAGPPPEPVRLGYPPYLGEMDLAKIATLALPGLAGLFGLTALGGLLGYRQAKAGYALRTAGIARFLQ